MERSVFDESQPTGTMSLDNLRNNFKALFMMDMLPLRVRACATPAMSVIVDASGDASAYFDHVYIGSTPLEFAGGATAAVTAPTANPRIDLVKIGSNGSLGILTGAEAVAPVAPFGSLASDDLPLALLYCKTGMSSIVNYEDKDANATEGYIYKDIRPFLNLGKAKFVDLTDTPSSFTDGKFLRMNASSVIGDDIELNDLSDTDVGSPSDEQVLQYSISSGKWQGATGGKVRPKTGVAADFLNNICDGVTTEVNASNKLVAKPDDDATLGGATPSATKSPSQKAVQTFVNSKGANYQVFTSNGTWVKPSSGNMVIIEAWGGGGGGGNLYGSGSKSGAGGGGGGAYARRIIPLSAIPGNVTVVVGAGGVGGVPDGNVEHGSSGNNGASSTFGTYLTAFGGGGGNAVLGNRSGGGGGGAGSSGLRTGASGGGGGYDGGGAGGRMSSEDEGTSGGDGTGFGGGGGGGIEQTPGPGYLNISKNGGRSIFGGGGGASANNISTSGAGGVSLYGGNGARNNTAAEIPGGGGCGMTNSGNGNGARGEVRVWVV